MKTQTLLRIKPPTIATWDTEPMRTILFKMCKAVGANYYKMNFSAPQWFTEHSWLEVEEEEFQIWMADKLYRLPSWRKAFKINKRKKEAMRVAKDFTWNHGWKTYSGS